MKKIILITIFLLWILLEIYLIIKNYSNGNPIMTNVVLLIGFLGGLYFISGKNKKDE